MLRCDECEKPSRLLHHYEANVRSDDAQGRVLSEYACCQNLCPDCLKAVKRATVAIAANSKQHPNWNPPGKPR